MNHCNWDMQDSIDNPILIIHSNKYSKDRTENVNKLYSLNPDNATIIDAKFDFDEDEILYWTDSDNFLCMPSIMYTEKVIGRVGCLLSHIKALEHIVENKLNDTIIFEDDAYLKDGKLDDLLEALKEKKNQGDLISAEGHVAYQFPHDFIVYLGYSQNPKNDCVYCCHAYLIPRWERAEYILGTINCVQQKKAIDSMLVKYIQKAGFHFSYYDIFGQNAGYSYIDKKDKKKPGQWV